MFREVRCPVCDRFEGYADGSVVAKCKCGQLIVSEPSSQDQAVSKEQAISQFKRKLASKSKSKAE